MKYTVIIAEKPSVGADLGKVLGIEQREKSFIKLKNGDYITWAYGHLFTQLNPKEYGPEWAKPWAQIEVPMFPEKFLNKIGYKKEDQVRIIKKLLKDAHTVVIATDAGREGELIGREILEYCNFRGTVKRFWTSSLTDKDIRKALAALQPGVTKEPLYQAALVRQHADWMYGMNLTIQATVSADTGEMFSVGRVQTPTLSLVVKRDLEIEGFQPKTYYELEADVTTRNGHKLKMRHAPKEKEQITSKAEAVRRMELAKGCKAPLSVEETAGADSPPQPYSQPAMQADADRLFKFPAAKTLEVAQKLYEKKAITYPRTDCEFLAEDQATEVPGVLENLQRMFPDAVKVAANPSPLIRKSVFDDAKLTDHHAIVPTAQPVPLEGDELKLFTLIAQRYLQVLAPDATYNATKVILDANGVPFLATGRVYTNKSWRDIKLVNAA
jgi:DNA topoisomerase-3